MDSIISELSSAPAVNVQGPPIEKLISILRMSKPEAPANTTIPVVKQDIVTLPTIVNPRQHIHLPPVYDAALRLQRKVQPTIEPWAITPEADVPVTPAQVGGSTAGRPTLPHETHTVAEPAQRNAKTMLDLFI